MKAWHTIAFDARVTVRAVQEDGGGYIAKSPIDGRPLRIVASDGFGWDHISVSRVDRTPVWEELEHVKRIFFADNETAMQLHVPVEEHINHHPHCLHLWRSQVVEIPRPPAWMVA